MTSRQTKKASREVKTQQVTLHIPLQAGILDAFRAAEAAALVGKLRLAATWSSGGGPHWTVILTEEGDKVLELGTWYQAHRASKREERRASDAQRVRRILAEDVVAYNRVAGRRGVAEIEGLPEDPDEADKWLQTDDAADFRIWRAALRSKPKRARGKPKPRKPPQPKAATSSPQKEKEKKEEMTPEDAWSSASGSDSDSHSAGSSTASSNSSFLGSRSSDVSQETEKKESKGKKEKKEAAPKKAADGAKSASA